MAGTMTKTKPDAGFAQLLPMPVGEHQAAQMGRYVRKQAEVILKSLVISLRNNDLSYEKAIIGLARIAGYYDILAEAERGHRRDAEIP